MYTKEQVDDMLSQVEQEFEKSLLGSIAKSEKTEENIETEESEEEIEMTKSEDSVEETEDYETIDDLYDSMTKSEKEAHYTAVKKALFSEEESEEEVVEMTKSEKDEVKMAKSEVDSIKAENQELKKNLDTMNELVSKIFNKGKQAPKRKSITESYEVIAKSEGQSDEGIDLSKLSKSEITKKLKAIDYSELKKSDRTAINNFYLENASVNSIKHLIKE